MDEQSCDIRGKACETQVYPIGHRKDLPPHVCVVIHVTGQWRTMAYPFKVQCYRHCTRTKTQITSNSDAVFPGHCNDRSTVMFHYRLTIGE